MHAYTGTFNVHMYVYAYMLIYFRYNIAHHLAASFCVLTLYHSYQYVIWLLSCVKVFIYMHHTWEKERVVFSIKESTHRDTCYLILLAWWRVLLKIAVLLLKRRCYCCCYYCCCCCLLRVYLCACNFAWACAR